MLHAALLLLYVAASEPSPHALVGGIATFSYTSSFFPSVQHFAAELSYEYERGPFEIGGGFRSAVPRGGAPVPLEVLGRARLRAVQGAWEPALGPELGWSGFTQIFPYRPDLPGDSLSLLQSRVSGFYLGLEMAPVRFRLRHVLICGPSLLVATTLFPFGTAARVQLNLLAVGGAL